MSLAIYTPECLELGQVRPASGGAPCYPERYPHVLWTTLRVPTELIAGTGRR